MTDRSASTSADGGLAHLAETDPHRPRFHFVAPGGWLNDPNGVGQRDGVFHLFYQYNPVAPVHDRIHWGHSTSTDLVHWTDEPIALVPDAEGPDSDGCWSGVLVDHDGTPTIIYSGRHEGHELPCSATGSADLRTWTKASDNPIIAGPPEGIDVVAFRDHCVWPEGDRWFQLVGSGIRGVGGTVFLYQSTDLHTWTFVRALLTGDADEVSADDPRWTGSMWECVDFFRLHPPGSGGPATSPPGSGGPGTDLLVFSAWHEEVTHHALFWTGRYADGHFAADRLERLDYGGRYFYAPQSFRDEAGRRIMFGWIQEGRDEAATTAVGWSGVMSLPREVVLAEDGTVVQKPASDVDVLRHDGVRLGRTVIEPGRPVVLPKSGDQLDLEIDLEVPPGATAALDLRVAGRIGSPHGERTTLTVDRRDDGTGTVALDRSRSSLNPDVDVSSRSGAVPVGADDLVTIRAVVDRSVLEIFVNHRPLTARVYPTRKDALGVELRALQGTVTVRSAEIWSMASVWAGPRALRP